MLALGFIKFSGGYEMIYNRTKWVISLNRRAYNISANVVVGFCNVDEHAMATNSLAFSIMVSLSAT
ncbi:hypothetical protein AFCDBAGC_5041 [Methylobacterium cerastii]|uniref:Uncharacterized protein n=1 Tax=Methylobacterium cerastii TaxID=932741 RepID=A0ABQ4QQT1_9HYPH|nr:hypothetical protein AFCDBAGC_5041 [Methylobacterium cerastii]